MGNAQAAKTPEIQTPTSNAMVNTSAPPTTDAAKPAAPNANAPSTPDVLTRISGIGDATQTVLFRHGVTTFKKQ